MKVGGQIPWNAKPICETFTDLLSDGKTPCERRWPGGWWGPQGRASTGGGGLVRVPNLRVCKHLSWWRWHTQGEKDELTSCRGTVQSVWQHLQ